MGKGKFVIGTVLSVAAGVVAGILTAPKSGKETRADLKTKADELKGNVEDKTEKVKGKISFKKESDKE